MAPEPEGSSPFSQQSTIGLQPEHAPCHGDIWPPLNMDFQYQRSSKDVSSAYQAQQHDDILDSGGIAPLIINPNPGRRWSAHT
jgi:hypothetical protein